MKLVENMPTIYLGEYDVHVNKYLTYAQIQQIVDSTQVLASELDSHKRKCDYWSARQQHIDMMLLISVTDIPAEKLVEITHTEFQQSGLIDAVKEAVINYNQLQEAFDYTEAWDKTLAKIVDSFTNVLEKNKYDLKAISQIVKDAQNGN